MTAFIGEKWWAGAYVISGLSLYNQTLYAMSSDTTVYAFNALTGTVEWTIPAVAANIQGNTGNLLRGEGADPHRRQPHSAGLDD